MSKAKKDDAVSTVAGDETDRSTQLPDDERRSAERRDSDDRRAFWRPTPDRRRERTERGRRSGDAS